MAEVIVFPDIEPVIVAYLNAQYSTYSVDATAGTKVPLANSTVTPAMFTRVIRTGGSVTDRVIDRVQLTIDSYGDTEEDAAVLAQKNRAFMLAIDQFTHGGVTYQFYDPQEFAAPGNLPDPDSGQERYTETLSVGVRGKAL